MKLTLVVLLMSMVVGLCDVDHSVVEPVEHLELSQFTGRWFLMEHTRDSTTDSSEKQCVCSVIDVLLPNISPPASSFVIQNEVSLTIHLSSNTAVPGGQLHSTSAVATNYDFLTSPGKWRVAFNAERLVADISGITSEYWVLALGEVGSEGSSVHPKGILPKQQHHRGGIIGGVRDVYHGPVGLDPRTGVDIAGKYSWAILYDASESHVFVLARDVLQFGLKFRHAVMQKLQSMGVAASNLQRVEQTQQCVYPAPLETCQSNCE
jgi:hypothetical protein